VTVGYTYGYMGTVVSADGVVVYGTGYYYTPYIGPTAWVPVPVTYGYASGQRGATYNPNTGAAARGGSATVGNAYTGSQNTAKWGQVSGPGGQSASAAKVGNNYYAGHDGNVYKNTGSGWEQRTGGGWGSVQNSGQVQSLQSQQQARQAGQQRSAASASRGSWGGGFSGSRPSGGGGGRRC
jgi:hypothetical protein